MVGNGAYEAGYYKVSAFAGNISLTEEQWNNFNLAGFTCASGREASNRVNHHVPVWRYMYFGEWPNSIIYPGSGSYHGTDVAQVFGTAEDASGGVPDTKTEKMVSAYMMRAWAMFTSNPESGLLDLGWPTYSEKGDTLVRLAFNNEPIASLVAPSAVDSGCAALGTDTSYAQGAF